MQVHAAIGLAATSKKIRKLAGWLFLISVIVLVISLFGALNSQAPKNQFHGPLESGGHFVMLLFGSVVASFWTGVVWVGAIVVKWLLTDDSNQQ